MRVDGGSLGPLGCYFLLAFSRSGRSANDQNPAFKVDEKWRVMCKENAHLTGHYDLLKQNSLHLKMQCTCFFDFKEIDKLKLKTETTEAERG